MNNIKDTYQKKSGFKTPDNYFKEFKVNKLDLLTKDQFKVPSNYFEDFKVKTPQTSKVIPLKTKAIAFVSSMAAAVALIALAFNYNSKTAPQTTHFSTIGSSEIENYIEYELENPEDYINSSLIIDFNNVESSKLSSEEIANYLGDDLYDNDYSNN